MLVKALKSFAGTISMYTGEIREIADGEIAKDLLNAGYIEEVKEAKVAKKGGKKEEAEPVEEAEPAKETKKK